MENTYMTNYVRLCYVAQFENRQLLEELLYRQTSPNEVCRKVFEDIRHDYRGIRNYFKEGDADLIRECSSINSFAKLHQRLIYLLLRNLHLVNPPTNGWCDGPLQEILTNTIGDCVDLIHRKYNLILHSGKNSFTDEETRELFSIFKNIARTFENFLHKNDLVLTYVKLESCCVDNKMRCNYSEHLHLLENGLKERNGPRCHPGIVGTDALQLSQEVTNYMRVIYAIQVVVVNDLRKFIATLLPPERFKNEILKDQDFLRNLPNYVKIRINQCHQKGYSDFSLSLMKRIITNRYLRIENLCLNIDAILKERNRIIFRGNTHLTDKEMIESFRNLKQIAKDLDMLKLQMNLPFENLVATLKYYRTCCMDEQIYNWYHESLIDLAEKEQQFGTSRHFPNQERTTRFWYLPDLSAKKLLETTPIDPGSQYVLIGYAFEEKFSQILQELLSHVVPHCLLFTKIFCAHHSEYFSAEEYLLFLESQKNGYLDFDTMLLSCVMLCLKKTKDTPFLQKIRETKHELLKKEKKELTENETKQYFSFFKDVATSVEKILFKPEGHFVSLFEKLENLLMKGEQMKVLFACLNDKAQKQQKPNWTEKKSVVQTSSLLDSKEFYELMKHGVYISYENRLYFGGPCNAGKTSLACILTGDEVPDTWLSTNGLQFYFGQNGIHLKDKKMIPIRKGMNCHTVHSKVISAIHDKQKKDLTPNPKANSDENKEVNRVESTETVPTGYEVEESSSKTKYEDDCEKDEKVNLKKTFKEKFDTDESQRSKHTTKITEPKSSIEHVKHRLEKTELKLAQTPTTKDDENEESDSSAAKKPKLSLISKVENTQTKKIKEKVNPNPEFLKTQISKSSSSSKTLNVIQDETLRKSILDEIRNGEYNLEIAPSDLVDFGGQKAFDMTHQLFILQEGTVLLLFDGSKDLEEPPCRSIILIFHQQIFYCIGLIQSHHTVQKKLECAEYNLSLLIVTAIRIMLRSDGKSLNKDDNEIDKLKDKLVEIAFSQKSWGKEMPLIWVPLENQLVDLKLKGTSILRMEEIQKLNRLNEDLMMDDENLIFFLRTQHALGKLIFFDKDELAEFVIIEPSVLVNALRSFVTDEIFFPQQDRECYNILKKLEREGMLKKVDLMKLWNQDEFQAIFQNQDYKDFLVKILLHLDVLVEPLLDNHDVSFSEEYYIVTNMVQSRFDNDYVETYLNRSRSICMSYVFKLNMAPSNVLFRVIAAAVGIFPLKEYRGQKMIFEDIATFVFDEKNEFSIIKEGNKIIVYFTHANSTRKIQPSKVASVQEWLTTVIISIIEFYQLNSRGVDALHKTNFGKPFELEYGAACQRPCFVNEEEIMRSKAGMWKCRHDLLHEVDYLWYWDSKKFQENIEINVTKEIKLSSTVLIKTPTQELLRKLSFELGTNGTRLGLSLGINSSVIENNIIVNKYNVFEKTQKILHCWEMLGESVTVEVLVKALENIGSRGLETIAKYYSHKPVKRCRSKSVPFLLSTKEDLTDEKDWFFKLKISCDKYDMHLIIDRNLQTKYRSLSETVNKTVISQQKRGTKRKRQDIEDSSTSSEECHDSSINEDISTEGLKSMKPNQSVFEQIYKQTNCKKRSIISVEDLYENQDLLYRFILARNLCPSDVLYILRKAMDYQLHVISKAFSWYFLRSAIKQTNLSEFFSRVNDIWPGFFCRCKKDKKGHSAICSKEPVIVIDADEYLVDLQEEINGIPVRQSAYYLKTENTEDKSDTFIEESSIPTNIPTISGENAQRLFLQHTKLTLVYISITEPGCVQLGCQAKGIIPMGEEHLPVVICSINTKVLHGHVSFLTKMHVGSRIGVIKKTACGTAWRTSLGTLGGFVKRRGRKAFLTCSHVIYDKSTLLSRDKRDKYKEEIKVQCYFNNNAQFFDCGIVIDDVFEYENSGRTSVDAAVVLLDSNVSEIDENEIIQITDSGQNRWLQPKFLGMESPYLDENYKTHEIPKGVMKARLVGAKSGYIERNVIYEHYDAIKANFKNTKNIQGVIVKWEDVAEQFEKLKIMNPKPILVATDAHFQTKLIPKLGEEEENNPRFVRFYHQLLMENLPFEKGDSGTCIYIVDDQSHTKDTKEANSTGCIGMAIADVIDSKGKKKVIVTPMEAILEALRLI
ncbi:unnamed protein product [Mytilus coruscus]|uniref:Death domain-containing protein n=1 Tax=Mytilus coruscus TaxID=42192 RepID=A0A6J8ADZ5_MYTCO|nr:unnamed protein product [Mytilus coruscus]